LLDGDMPTSYTPSPWSTAYTHSLIVTGNPHMITASAVGAEPALGNPGVNGYVLSSTVGGVRSWVAMTGGGAYTFASGLTEAAGTADLGGALSSDVQFTGGGTYDFLIGTAGSKINSFDLYADNAIIIDGDATMTLNADGILLMQHNAGGKSISLNTTSMLVTDTDDTIGFQYAADYSTNGIALGARWIPDWAAVIGQIASKNISSLVSTPTVTQDGYFLSWDNSLGQYNLIAAAGSSYSFSTGITEAAGAVSLGGAFASNIAIESVNDSDLFIKTGDGTDFGWVGVEGADTSSIGSYKDSAGGSSSINIDVSSIMVLDVINTTGLQYFADYSTAGKILGARWIPDWNAVTTQIGSKDVTALITAPAVGQNGYAVTWDNGGLQYTLTALTTGNVTKVGTPANTEIGVWTGDGTLGRDANLTWDGTDLGVVGGVVASSLVVGNSAALNSDDAYIYIIRDCDDTVAGNGHAFSDSTDITRSGVIGYASYQITSTITADSNVSRIMVVLEQWLIYMDTITIQEFLLVRLQIHMVHFSIPQRGLEQ